MNYCYRIYPDAAQEQQLLEWLETSRQVYNYGLREIKDWINSRKCSINYCSLHWEYIISADTPFPNYFHQQNALPKAKEVFPRLKQVPSQVLQTTLRRLHDAWDFFQKRKFGFPRFRKYGQIKSLLFPQFITNPITGWLLQLPKLGKVPINLHRPIPDGFVVKQVKVCRKAQRWEAIIAIISDISIPFVKPHGHALGIDLGLSVFVATSEGEMISRPRFLASLHRQLKLLQRKYARTKKGSKNRERARLKLAKFHSHIASTRKDYHYKLANHLCSKPEVGMVFVEDLNLKAMSKGMLRKHTLDAAFGQFLKILELVAFKHQVYFGRVDPNGTSQTCPQYGSHTGKKQLSERVHQCHICGYRADRDHAAAAVIKQRGLELISTQGLWGIENAYAVGLPGIGVTRCWSEAKSRKRATRNFQS